MLPFVTSLEAASWLARKGHGGGDDDDDDEGSGGGATDGDDGDEGAEATPLLRTFTNKAEGLFLESSSLNVGNGSPTACHPGDAGEDLAPSPELMAGL